RHPEYAAAAAPATSSWLGSLAETFQPEITKLKGLAVGTLLGALRDTVARAVPDQLSSQVTEVIDNVTRKLGGQPIRGPLYEEESAGLGHASRAGTGREKEAARPGDGPQWQGGRSTTGGRFG